MVSQSISLKLDPFLDVKHLTLPLVILFYSKRRKNNLTNQNTGLMMTVNPQNNPCHPPSTINSLREISAPVDWAKTLSQLPNLLSLPKGDGRPVVLVPGYLADELSMWPLKSYLSKMGYDTYHWELGRNRGNVDEDIVRLGEKVLTLHHALAQQSITLIGWSLGGVLTREVARLFPEAVREVITMGTPVTGGPKYTALGKRYARKNNIDLDSYEHQILARNQIGFSQPITSIYSKSDGVVGWRASVDVYNAQAQNIEVKGTHLGLGINASVWEIIINTLAQKA